MPIRRRVVETCKAPQAIGPYSQAVLVGPTLYISGQLGLDPATMELVPGGVEAQMAQALSNVEAILQAAKGSLQDVVQVKVLLQDVRHLDKVNGVYWRTLHKDLPASATCQVAALPKGGLVEVEAVAIIGARTAGNITAMPK